MSFIERNHWLWAASAPFVVASALVTQAAQAQGNAVITGTVRDASTKAPVADVVVTITSPALQGEQVVVTDASGLYRIPQLPPGEYMIRLEKETYRPYSRPGVAARVGSTIRVNIDLLPEVVQSEDEVVVVGRAPTVDVGSAQTGATVDSAFIKRMALSPPSVKGSATRSFESVAEVAPTAHTDTYGMSISGTTSPENQYVIDGVSVNDPGFGIVGTPLSVEFVDQVNVITGGYLPEYGRATGGVLDVVTRSGSNEFHGTVFTSITPGVLEGERALIKREGQTITTDTSLSSIHDFGAGVGGPILKDKLWFFVGLSPSFARYKLERNLNRIVLENGQPKVDESTGFTVTERIPGTTRTYYAEQQNLQYIGKLTFLINQDHSLTLSVYGGPSSSGGNGGFGIRPQTGGVETGSAGILGAYTNLAHIIEQTSNDVSLKYSASFLNKTLLFDATLGWHHATRSSLPSDGSQLGSNEGLARFAGVIYRRTSPGFHNITEFEAVPNGACDPVTVTGEDGPTSINVCPVTTYNYGGPGFIEQGILDRYQGKAVVTGLVTAAGHHVIKGGVDVELMSFDHQRAYTGGVLFRESTNGERFEDYRRFGYMAGPDDAVTINADVQSASTAVGAFVQDSWSILDKATLNAGIRYDAQVLGANGVTGMVLPNQWSPRVGVIYDFTQSGRSKVFVNFARYYESIPLDLADRSLTRGGQTRGVHLASGCNPKTIEGQQGGCADIENQATIGNLSNPSQHWRVSGGSKIAIDPDISPQSSDELVIGGEYEVLPDARLGLQYTKRYMNSIIEDMSRDEGLTYFLGNPGHGIASDFPKATRNYDAVTFYLNKVFSNGWLAQASYTLSTLRGNWAGLFRPETGQLDPNINSDFDLISLLPNREGALPGDRTHQIKVYGAKDFSPTPWMALNVGLSFRTRSGEPTNYLGAHPTYGSDEVFILPRGSGERLPWVHSFDGHLGVGYRLGKESDLVLSMDVFNIFNFQEVTAIDNTYTRAEVRPVVEGKVGDVPAKGAGSCNPAAGCKLVYTNGEPFNPTQDQNPNFGNPTDYQPPRTFRFGAKVTF